MHLFQEVQDKGLISNVSTDSMMLQGLFQSGNPTVARELFSKMQAKGMDPNMCIYPILFHGMYDNATYSTLINGLVLADRVFEAIELFKKLLSDRFCEPDQIMFGTIINGLCKVGHTSKALELLSFMESGSCKPCVQQYNAVIDSLCKDKMVDDALHLFAKMTEKGVLANVHLQLFDSRSM
ncbi:hypothetical protein R6Q57_005227 [Mikania cordata]